MVLNSSNDFNTTMSKVHNLCLMRLSGMDERVTRRFLFNDLTFGISLKEV